MYWNIQPSIIYTKTLRLHLLTEKREWTIILQQAKQE